jgi:hypothetical protein
VQVAAVVIGIRLLRSHPRPRGRVACFVRSVTRNPSPMAGLGILVQFQQGQAHKPRHLGCHHREATQGGQRVRPCHALLKLPEIDRQLRQQTRGRLVPRRLAVSKDSLLPVLEGNRRHRTLADQAAHSVPQAHESVHQR